jgi:hypothetical protein
MIAGDVRKLIDQILSDLEFATEFTELFTDVFLERSDVVELNLFQRGFSSS